MQKDRSGNFQLFRVVGDGDIINFNPTDKIGAVMNNKYLTRLKRGLNKIGSSLGNGINNGMAAFREIANPIRQTIGYDRLQVLRNATHSQLKAARQILTEEFFGKKPSMDDVLTFKNKKKMKR